MTTSPQRRTFDRHGCIDESDERSGNADEVCAAPVRGASVSSDISAEAKGGNQMSAKLKQLNRCHIPSTNDKNRLLPQQAERIHGVDNG